MNLRDIARLANVSVSTVSKAFHNADDVSPETKELVFSIAKEHGCFGKYYNGKYKKRTVALILPELRSDFYSRYAEKLQQFADEETSILLVSSYDFNHQKQAELIDYYADHLRVDGIICFGVKILSKNYEIPIINFGDSESSIYGIDCINSDISHAIFCAVKELVDFGHTKIGFISEQLTLSKMRRFLTYAKQLGLSVDKQHTVVSPFRFEMAGVQGVEQLLSSGDPPTAIICAYDDIAFGAIRTLTDRGYSVPRDFSVVGMDNILIANYAGTPLSTIDSGCDEMCFAAWDLLKKKLNNKYYKLPHKITVTGEYISRGTTGPVKK